MRLSAIHHRPLGSGSAWGRLGVVLGLAVAVAGCSKPPVNGVHPIGPGEEIVFDVTLAKGDYLFASAAPQKVDIVLSLLGPEDAKPADELPSSDGSDLRGAQAEEEVAWIAKVPGRYRLRVAAPAPIDAGSFKLLVEGPRPPSPEDEKRVRALEIFLALENGKLPEDPGKREAVLAPGPELWHDFHDPVREAVLLLARGNARRILSRLEPAEADLARAQALFRQLGARKGEAAALNNRALIQQQRGQHEAAIARFEEARRIFHEIGSSKEEARALANRGNSYIELENVQAAIASLQRAREIQERDKAPELAKTLSSLGDAYEARNDKEAAREVYEQALSLGSQDPEGLAAIHQGLGAYYQSLGDWSRAIENYQSALEDLEPLPAYSGKARTLNNLGRVYSWMRQPDKARESFQRALDELAKLEGTAARDRQAEAYVFTNLAFLYLREKQFGPARDLVDRARKIPGANDQLQTTSLEVEGAIYRELKDWPRARLALDRALVLSGKLENPQRQAAVLLALARLDRDQGALQSAHDRIRKALRIVESSRSRLLNQEQRSTLLASRRNYYDFYLDLLGQLHAAQPRAGHDREALEVSEGAHARSLLEALGEGSFDFQSGGNPALLEERQKLLGSLEGTNLRISTLRRQSARAAQVQEAESHLMEVLEKLSRIEDKLRRSSPRYAELTRPEPFSAREIQRQAADGDALVLEYWLGEERSFVWAVSAHRVASFVIPVGREVIENNASAYYRALLEPGNPRGTPKSRQDAAAEAQRLGDWLSETLLKPVADLLGDKPLLIVADGSLHYVPFSVLPDPTRPSAPRSLLLERHQLVNLPSISVLGRLRKDAGSPPPDSVAIFADPVFERNDERIPEKFRQPLNVQGGTLPPHRLRNSGKEADAICNLLGRQSGCRIFSGFNASVAQVKGIDLRQFGIVHFATHGELKSEAPELSSLILSLVDERGQPQEGFLRLHDIYNLKLHAKLVVLSACKTALGKEIRGEGLVGLTRGFMYAGAKRVLASLWSVDSVATQELMEKLYRQMAERRLSPAQALQAAQIEMSADPTWNDPYYWAGFSLQGEWR